MRRTIPKLLVLLLLFLPGAEGAAAAVVPTGDEIRLDTPESCNAALPDVASLTDGGFVAVWREEDPPRVLARRFDAAGQPKAPGFVVAVLGFATAVRPRVVGGPDGGYVVAWTDPGRQLLLARVYGTGDRPHGGEIELATSAPDHFALASGTGGFVALWERGPADLAGLRFDADGRSLASFEIVGSLGGARSVLHRFPAVAFDGRSRILAAWVLLSPGFPFPTAEVQFQRFNATGQPLDDARTLGNGADPAVAALAGGRAVVVWPELVRPRGVAARLIGPSGELIGKEPVLVGAADEGVTAVAVLGLPDGGFSVAWETAPGPATEPLEDHDILTRSMTAAGLPSTPVLVVSDSAEFGQRHPRLAATGDGTAMVTWWSEREIPPVDPVPACLLGQGIFARALAPPCSPGDRNLCLRGDRFRVSVEWRDPINGGAGSGRPIPLTDDTGGFWFFHPDNLELTVKVIDGRPVNGHFWVFAGSMSNVGYQVTVRDEITGEQRSYDNPPGTFGSFGDSGAFFAPVTPSTAP